MSSGYYLTPAFYYINLGAHMIYILRNRLEAQRIMKEKIIRILRDVSGAVFKEHFITQLLLPQDPLNVSTLKELFSKLAHCSIMKLDQASMDKMFYLMLLSVKKEIFLTSSPIQLYSLTLGHLLNLVKYLEGSNVPYLQFAINEFQKTAKKYSFIQYLEIKEYILSELEKYQTKIVNFIDSGIQCNNGRLIFRVRNSHNQKSIGSAANQNQQQCSFTKVNPQNELFYKDWITWKCDLVIDFVQDYKQSSIKRSAKPTNSLVPKVHDSKQKSLSDMFNLKFDDLENFEVKFDIFENQSNQVSTIIEKPQEQRSNLKKATQFTAKNTNSYKSQIEKQFAELKFDKKQDQQQEEPDLLQMMDS